MGKLLSTEDGVQFNNIHLGCMSGVFPALDYQNWHSNVKKILPQRKQARQQKAIETSQLSAGKRSLIWADKKHNSHTRSIKYRLKSLVSDKTLKDGHKKRGPKLQRTYSIHHLDTDEWVLPVVLDSQSVNSEEFSVKEPDENNTNQDIEDYVDISEKSKINKKILLDGSQVSLTKANLTKSSSFPSMLGSRNLKPTKLKHKLHEFYSLPKNEKGSDNLAQKLDLSKLESFGIDLDQQDGKNLDDDLNNGSVMSIKRICSLNQQDGLRPLCVPEEDAKNNIESVNINTHDHNEDEYFNYVKEILERSGFIKNGFEQTWYASNQPLNPSMFQELESQYPYDPQCFGEELVDLSHHLHRFELVDETLLKLYERSFSYYPKPLSYSCHLSPAPSGKLVLEEIWKNLSRLLNLKTDMDQSLESIVCWDLRVGVEWMNLQTESESIGIELEDMIFNELLGEVLCS